MNILHRSELTCLGYLAQRHLHIAARRHVSVTEGQVRIEIAYSDSYTAILLRSC